MPPNVSKAEVAEKLVVLSMFTEYQWEDPVVADLELINSVLQFNNYSVDAAIDYLGTTCENFILRCLWSGEEFPCRDIGTNISEFSFKSSYSFLGACCSINYFPDGGGNLFKTDTIGILGGLTVILTGAPQISDGKSGALYSDGFVVKFFLVKFYIFSRIKNSKYISF